MSAGVDAESVNAHLDERAVAVDQILGHSRVLGVQVNTVTCDLCPPARVVIPVKLPEVVPIVVSVVILIIGVLHHLQSHVILLARGQAAVVGRQFAAHRVGGVGEHALVDLILIGVAVTREQFAKVLLAKVARVVEHNVKQHFHSARVSFVNEGLKCRVAALVAVVNAAKVARMVAVIIQSRGILDDRGYPYCRESQRLDVVQLVNQSLEVATPARVAAIGSASVPALRVVARVTVIKARSDHKIDALITKVVTRPNECRPCLLRR